MGGLHKWRLWVGSFDILVMGSIPNKALMAYTCCNLCLRRTAKRVLTSDNTQVANTKSLMFDKSCATSSSYQLQEVVNAAASYSLAHRVTALVKNAMST